MKDVVWSFLMICSSEIGDKTFLIACLMSMRNSRLLIFTASGAALVLMTLLSAFLGYVVTVVPKLYIQLLSSLLFLLFGIKTVKEAMHMEDNVNHEMEEVQEELNAKTEMDLESGKKNQNKGAESLVAFLSPIFVQTFVLTFIGEWGDRSQLATVVMAASQNISWVIVGTIFGHLCCTAVAVIGGRLLASKISIRTVTLIGGFLFLFFAAMTLYEATNFN